MLLNQFLLVIIVVLIYVNTTCGTNNFAGKRKNRTKTRSSISSTLSAPLTLLNEPVKVYKSLPVCSADAVPSTTGKYNTNWYDNGVRCNPGHKRNCESIGGKVYSGGLCSVGDVVCVANGGANLDGKCVLPISSYLTEEEVRGAAASGMPGYNAYELI